MKVLGFRADPQAPRFALVEADSGAFTLLNADSENKLAFPAQCIDEASRLHWLQREVERILHNNADICRVVIKTNEYKGAETKARRFSSYEEGVVLSFFAQKAIPTFVKTYSTLATNSTDVKADAASRVGQTSKGWDPKMADAVVAAWWGGNH